MDVSEESEEGCGDVPSSELLTEFFKHVYLGQWELASASALTYVKAAETSEDAKKYILTYLKNVACFPTKFSICEEQHVKTPSHLSWLVCKFIQDTWEEEDLTLLSKDAEFRVQLQEVLQTSPIPIREELYRLYCSLLEGNLKPSEELSSECCIYLREALFQQPVMTHHLFTSILSCSTRHNFPMQLQRMYLQCLSRCLKQLFSTNISPTIFCNFQNRVLYLLSVMPDCVVQNWYNDDQLGNFLTSALEDVVRLVDLKLLNEQEVYGRLICRSSPILLKQYVEKEDQFLLRVGDQDDENFLEKCSFMEYKELFLRSLINKEHFIETLLNKCVTGILHGQQEKALEVLNNKLLSCIYPLSLVLSWNKADTVEMTNHVLQAIQCYQKPEHSDPGLEELLERLKFNLRVAEWIVSVLKEKGHILDISHEENKRKTIFTQLQNQSFLSVLHRTVGLGSVRSADILKLLQEGQQGAAHHDAESSTLNTQDSYLFHSCLRDSMIYRGYKALRHAMEAIQIAVHLNHVVNSPSLTVQEEAYPSLDDLEDFPSWNIGCLNTVLQEHGFEVIRSKLVIGHLQKSQAELAQVFPLTYRVEIMENIFSLLFITHSDVQTLDMHMDTDDGCDSDERHIQCSLEVDKHNQSPKVISIEISSSCLPGSPESPQELLATPMTSVKDSASDTHSGKGSSTSSRNSLDSVGFLCPDFLVSDILQSLNNAILNTEAAVFKHSAFREESPTKAVQVPTKTPLPCAVESSIPQEELAVHLKGLKKYVLEAQWRFDLITSNTDEKQFSGRHFLSPQINGTDSGRLHGIGKSDGVCSSKDKKKKCQRRRRSSRRDAANPTIIQRMLGSMEALLRHNLWHENFKKAGQIIDFLQLHNTPEAQEYFFSKTFGELLVNLNKLLQEIHGSNTLKTRHISSKGLSAVAQAAQEGLHFTAINDQVEKFLCSTEVPVIMETEVILNSSSVTISSADRTLLDEYKLSPSAVVICDLALTSSLDIDVSEKLLSSAWNRMQLNAPASEDSAYKKHVHSIGLKKMLHQIQGYVELVNHNRMSHLTDLLHEPEEHSTLTDSIICHLDTFDISSYKNHVKIWDDIQKVFKEVENLLQLSSEDTPMKSKMLHQLYIRLANLCSMELREQCQFLPPGNFSYLKSLYAHVRQVHKTLKDCARQGKYKVTQQSESYFSVLSQNPSALLTRLVLQDQVPPHKLEDFAKKLKMDLVQVLAKECCPEINLNSHHIAGPEHFLGSEQIVLNNTNSTWPSPVHPNFLVANLLKDLIYLIESIGSEVLTANSAGDVAKSRDFEAWEKKCGELQFIDLNLLTNEIGRLSFFINLTNLLSIHASLKQLSPAVKSTKQSFEHFLPLQSPYFQLRTTAEALVGYKVGQLGFISLYCLKNHLLFDGCFVEKFSEKPPAAHIHEMVELEGLERVRPSLDFRVLLVLNQGRMSDPYLRVIFPETLEEQLQTAKQKCFAQVSVNKEEKKVTLPWQFRVLDSVSSSHQSDLESLFDLMTSYKTGGFDLIFEPENMQFGIHYKDLEQTETSIHMPEPSSDIIELPEPVLCYLESRCGLLAQLLTFMSAKVSKRLPFEKKDSSLCVLKHLFMHYYSVWVRVPTKHSHQEWMIMALRSKIKQDVLWEALDSLATDKDWTLSLDVINLVDEMNGLSKFPYFQMYHQLILWHLATGGASLCESGLESSFASENKPWRNVLCMQDLPLKVRCLLSYHMNWPDEEALVVLKACKSECSKSKHHRLCKEIEKEMQRISLYKEIFEKSLEIQGPPDWLSTVNFSSWQAVAKYSACDPLLIFEIISHTACYELAVRWSQLHTVKEYCQKNVAELHILHCLCKSPPDPEPAYKVIESLKSWEDALLLCKKLLESLPLDVGKVKLLEYLIDRYKDKLHEEEILAYKKLIIGIQVLTCLDTYKKEFYSDLTSHPYLLLEQLLMNAEMETVGKAMKNTTNYLNSEAFPFSREVVNKLLEDYAKRALEFPVCTEPSNASVSSVQSVPKTVLLSVKDRDIFIMPSHPPFQEEWVPDSKVSTCMVCLIERFNMFSRRHHCRRCGRVVCWSCSQKSLVVEGFGSSPVRVCDECYEQTVNPLNVSKFSSSPQSADRILRTYSNARSSSPKTSKLDTLSANRFSICRLPLWKLTINEEENVNQRNEFFYEGAPSVSLCLSILQNHSKVKECGAFILSLCDNLFTILGEGKVSGQQIDYGLVISILKSLLLNAKIKFLDAGKSSDIEKSDFYLRKLDLVKLLVTANCKKLINSDTDSVRKLRDSLIEAERMLLALEVSTKCGLEKSGVWASWGLANLRAGDWALAREKFSHCLQKPQDRNLTKSESPLLKEIIASLENSQHPGISKAANVFCSIANLKSIKSGLAQMKMPGVDLKAAVFSECIYYIKKYGCALTMLRFLQKHSKIAEALKYVLEKNSDPDLFIEGLFMPSLKAGALSELLAEMKNIDPALSRWWKVLMAVCRYLQKQGLLHVLYHVQLFMEDYIRAAMTGIQFFQSPLRTYSELYDRLHYLTSSRQHFETYLSDYAVWEGAQTKTSKSRQAFAMPPKEVNRSISKISLQIDITKYLNRREKEGHLIASPGAEVTNPEQEGQPFQPLTLFGNLPQKEDLAVLLLINGNNVEEGFGLAFRIIQEHHISGIQVFKQTSKILIKNKKVAEVSRLVSCIQSCGYPEKYDSDEVVMTAIQALVELPDEKKDAEVLIKLFRNEINKMEAEIHLGRLRSAYLTAVRLNHADYVKKIMTAAESKGQETIRLICEKWFKAHGYQNL